MNLNESNGFFTEYYRKIKESILEDEINTKFGGLTSDSDRVAFISQLDTVRIENLCIKKEFKGKSAEDAQRCKEMANDAFKNKNWTEALILYGKAYTAMPAENRSDIAILLANRSAALTHMEKFDDALEDISRSLSFDYPKEMRHKLFERQAKCYLAKKQYPEALVAFKKTVTALDDCKMPLDKRSKIERDSMVMIKMLESDKKMAQDVSQKGKETDSRFLSDAIGFDFNDNEGRFAFSKRKIQVGDEILVERPNTFAVLKAHCKTHCQNCMRRTITPIACDKCVDIVFCSNKCLEEGMVYHKYECGVLPILWRSGASINCHMAMRMIVSKPLEYFLKLQDSIDKEIPIGQLRKLPENDYRRVCNLVRHEKHRKTSSFFQYSIMANFLNSLLREGGYYAGSKHPKDVEFIGGLILRNLQFLQFNTHEIFELHESKTGEAEKTVFIGGGIYPTLALFNHSCDPGIVKYYHGVEVHVSAIKPIESGQVVAENYGPLYTQEQVGDRREKLQELYWFDCECVACIENWPRYEEMDNSSIRFRCDADEKCPNIIQVPANCNDFMVKCVACGQFTNILKGLKVMQDTESMSKTARRLYKANDVVGALKKYIDILKIMYEVLAPPFNDFCQCQQHIKDCILHFGNRYVISE